MPKGNEKSLKMTDIKTTTKIDWNNIKIKVVSVDKEHPNEYNLYARLSAKEREQIIVSICGRIWARHIKEKLLKEKADI